MMATYGVRVGANVMPCDDLVLSQVVTPPLPEDSWD